MKVLKIETANVEPHGDEIVVTVEGYPHAQPTFPLPITKEDLEIALKAWKVKQDEVDVINAAAKAAVIDSPYVPPDISDLKVLEGKEVVSVIK